ncbi:MAG TPA: urease accessory UreF family protein [Polyangiaceae bacterium]|nr:urease accessory UreF family protein [Polyangiaceae bacterium]
MSDGVTELSNGALLSLLRLGSTSLPIGAFAYSQGLEQAVAFGCVSDKRSAEQWTTGLLRSSVMTCDVPVLLRLHAAWGAADTSAVQRWSEFLFATRATRELREEERQLGGGLFRWLVGQGELRAQRWLKRPRATLACAFALAGSRAAIPPRALALGYCFAWSEAQVGAATRLIPLGQTEAQGVLSSALGTIGEELDAALACRDDAISATAYGQALLSAAHETQYSRLFRS